MTLFRIDGVDADEFGFKTPTLHDPAKWLARATTIAYSLGDSIVFCFAVATTYGSRCCLIVLAAPCQDLASLQ